MMIMKRAYTTVLTAVLLLVPLFSSAQSPLIIINGTVTELTDLKSVNPQDIESIDTEPANEYTVAKYGPRANNGIVCVTLRYDNPAEFLIADTSFGDYISSHVKWSDSDPAARIVVRYTINPDGHITTGEVLESTDARLRRRVLAAMKAAEKQPLWRAAMRSGTPVATERVVQISLPVGKSMESEPYIIIL